MDFVTGAVASGPEVVAALIGIAGVLMAGLIANLGQARISTKQQKRRELLEDQDQWDRQLAEMLAAAVSAGGAIALIRGGWIEDTLWDRLRTRRRVARDFHEVLLPRLDRLTLALLRVTTWRGGEVAIVEQAKALAFALEPLQDSLIRDRAVFDEKAEAFRQELAELRGRVDRRRGLIEKPSLMRRLLRRESKPD
ncbi:hypothetical protein EDD29_0043 [Actinocorallia herbida]|uniref:Uncharacterized protein n=1 Tax=Actinocorallia herbida TaxID=58109 RepID=A0A3N1CMP5_9ACTN|nr:hypothetical protein [Actinocorallia herbida]ROO82563.1 hypothetical protein EDD29_0043 [Actinocorallia herbida]